MSARAQFWMNIGITAALGFYGTVGAIYAEVIKPDHEQSSLRIAVLITFGLVAFMATICLLVEAHSQIKDRELDDQ